MSFKCNLHTLTLPFNYLTDTTYALKFLCSKDFCKKKGAELQAVIAAEDRNTQKYKKRCTKLEIKPRRKLKLNKRVSEAWDKESRDQGEMHRPGWAGGAEEAAQRWTDTERANGEIKAKEREKGRSHEAARGKAKGSWKRAQTLGGIPSGRQRFFKPRFYYTVGQTKEPEYHFKPRLILKMISFQGPSYLFAQSKKAHDDLS